MKQKNHIGKHFLTVHDMSCNKQVTAESNFKNKKCSMMIKLNASVCCVKYDIE